MLIPLIPVVVAIVIAPPTYPEVILETALLYTLNALPAGTARVECDNLIPHTCVETLALSLTPLTMLLESVLTRLPVAPIYVSIKIPSVVVLHDTLLTLLLLTVNPAWLVKRMPQV